MLYFCLLHLCQDVKDSERKLICMRFFSEFQIKMAELKQDVDHLCAACEELRSSKRFAELLAVILVLGNDINGVDGGATVDGFTVDSLSRLSEVGLVSMSHHRFLPGSSHMHMALLSCRQRHLTTKHQFCNTW